MAFKSLREFLDALEEGNDLNRITAEVDWNEEIGAVEGLTLPGRNVKK